MHVRVHIANLPFIPQNQCQPVQTSVSTHCIMFSRMKRLGLTLLIAVAFGEFPGWSHADVALNDPPVIGDVTQVLDGVDWVAVRSAPPAPAPGYIYHHLHACMLRCEILWSRQIPTHDKQH